MITFIHKVTPIHGVLCCIREKFIINRDNAEGLTCCCGRSCPARRWREYSEGGPGRIDTCAVVIREMLNKRRLFRSHLEYSCPWPCYRNIHHQRNNCKRAATQCDAESGSANVGYLYIFFRCLCFQVDTPPEPRI
jgi:hypothetical protein